MHQSTPLKLLWQLQLNAASRSYLTPCILQFVPSDLYLFPNLKTNLRSRNFGSSDGVIYAVDEYFGDKEEVFYFEGISKLKQRWRKCI